MLASPGTVISWWYTAIQALASSQQDFHHNLGFLERLPELSKADFRKLILLHDGTQENGRTFCRFFCRSFEQKTPGNFPGVFFFFAGKSSVYVTWMHPSDMGLGDDTSLNLEEDEVLSLLA